MQILSFLSPQYFGLWDLMVVGWWWGGGGEVQDLALNFVPTHP